jgi:hypothetical protein
MAKDPEVAANPLNPITAQRVAAALFVAKSGSNENPYQLVNDFNLAQDKWAANKAHYDKLGQTMPATAVLLTMDAERNVRHSRILARNIYKADNSQIRYKGLDTHHIVGRLHQYAEVARGYLFNWGIGINDADNGVFLPRNDKTQVASIPNAHGHQGLHTQRYYFTITMRLAKVSQGPKEAGRTVLRTIKSELLSGTFPY